MIARIDAPLSQWERCVTKCLAERVPSSRFARLAQQFLGQDVEGRLLAERLLIRITDAGHDVLQQSYISAALDSGIFDEAHLLQALLDLTSPGKKAVQHSKKSFGKLSVRDQVAVIRLTTVSCNSRARPTTASQATDILDVVPKWMKRASLVSEETHDEADSYVGADEDIVSLQQAVAGIFCELANNVYVRTILESDLTPDEIKDSQPVGIAHDDLDVNPTLSEGLRIFIAQMSVTLHEYANALRNIQQSFASMRRREEKGTAFESTNTALIGMQLGANIQGASRPGRGGLLLYLDSILNSVPSATSEQILRFLMGQFQGDIGSLIIGLIASAFDLMAISRAQQQEGDETFLLQSFLISSVPSLVARASSMLSSAPNDEMLIAQALNQLDTDGQNAFNDAYGPAARNSQGPECQPAFIRACFKRGLLRHEHAQQLLASTGDTTLPGSPQPDRMRLADAVRSTQQKQQQIIDDLSGEGASVSLQAEVLCEHLHQLLDGGNTSSLKSLLECLASRPHALDNIFLLSDVDILEGVCRVIGDWQKEVDSDQAHESYEGFSACLTFMLFVKYRFGLDVDDLPDESPQSTIESLLASGYQSSSLEDSSPEESALVGDWLEALLENDQWGVSGDLLSKHSPQLFYRSAPMLYNQIFQAYDGGLLPTDKLANAVESLQTTVNLPALTIGVRVLISLGWQQSISITTITDLLQTMTTPTSHEEHRNDLHRAVLSCVREDLLAFLQDLERRHPDDKDLKSLLDKTSSLTPSRAPRHLPTEGLLNNQGGPASLLDKLGYAFNALCAWETTGAFPNSVFRHEDLLLTIQLYGCPRVLRSLIDLMILHRANAQPGEVDVALDLAAMFVVAHEVSKKKWASSETPDRAAKAPRQTLRRALQHEHRNVTKLMSRDPQRAQNIILLYQLVEHRLAPQPLQDNVAMQMPSAMEDVDLASAAGNMASASLAGQGMMQSLDQDATMMDFGNDPSVFGTGLDFDDEGFFAPPNTGMQGPGQGQAGAQGAMGGDVGMDFEGPPEQGHGGMDEQQFQAMQSGAQGDQQQQQQQDMDLFAGFEGPQDFFGQPGTEQQELEQTQVQGGTAAQQGPQNTGTMGAGGGQGTQAQSDEEFWASMGFG